MTLPEVGLISLKIILATVVFPLPLSPAKVTISPFSTSNVTFFTAVQHLVLIRPEV
jgi:hypothetical protein